MATSKALLEELLSSMTNPVADDVQHVTGIIYGDSGSGKTIEAIALAREVLKTYNDPKGIIVLLDAVNAWRSLKNHPDLYADGKVKRIPYSGKAQLDLLIEAIEFKPPGFENVRVIILDEMSSMTDRDGDLILRTRAAKDPSKDPDVLTQPDMGATTERMRRTVVDLLKLDISVIFVAHQRQDEDSALGFKVTRPRFMPKFSGTIREGLDFVVHMTASESAREGDTIVYRRQIQTQPTKTVVAKSRVGGLKLYETTDGFVNGVVKWLKGEVSDSVVDTVVDDVPVSLSEVDNDFGGIEIS